MINKSILPGLAFLFLTSIPSPGQLAGSALTVNLATPPTGLAAGDLDGDGILEVVVTSSISSTVSVLREIGGQYTLVTTLPTAAGPSKVAIADLDGDGLLDLAVTATTGNRVSVFLNAGNLTFQPGVDYASGFGPVDIKAVDVDSDQDIDLVLTNFAANKVGVLENLGGGSFAFVGSSFVGGGPTEIEFRDLDRDGDLDVVLALSAFNGVAIFQNTGLGLVPVGIFPTGVFPVDIAIADLNHDLRPDIITANVVSNDVTVLFNSGGLNYHPPVSYPAGNAPTSVAVLNVDNKLGLDVVVSSLNGNGLYVLTNNGLGALTQTRYVPMGLNPLELLAADLDGDRDLDLVTANVTSVGLGILLNQQPAVPYPGTNDDFELATGVDALPTTGLGQFIKLAEAGNLVTAFAQSPGGTFTGSPVGIAAQVFLPAFPPISPYPGLHLNQFGFGAVVLIQDTMLSPTGLSVTFPVPADSAGFHVLIQAGVINSLSMNRVLSLTDGYEIRVR